jgi:hypothetical protein
LKPPLTKKERAREAEKAFHEVLKSALIRQTETSDIAAAYAEATFNVAASRFWTRERRKAGSKLEPLRSMGPATQTAA